MELSWVEIMCIMQRTTKKIYLRMKSGAECIWLSHSAASSFTGSPATSTGMPRKSKVTLAVLLINCAFRLGTHVPPQRKPSAQGDLREPAHGVCTQGSLYKSQGSTLKASTNHYVLQVWKPLKKGRRPGVGSRGGFQQESATKQQTWTCCNMQTGESWIFSTPPFYLQIMRLIQIQCRDFGGGNV